MPRRNVIWIAAVVLVSLICWQKAPGAGRGEEDYEFYRLLVDALDHVEKSYVEPVDRKELIEGAMQGMLRNLDPYSTYISPENMQQFNRITQGRFGGIGIQIGQDSKTRQLTVISPLANTPAYRAGVLAGDKIVEIEGESTENVTLDQAVGKLTGAPGTSVTITIQHEGQTETETVTLTREEIQVQSVMGDSRRPNDSWDWIADKDAKIVYVRLDSFISSTAGDLDRSLKEAKEAGMTALVLDMRFNPGGLLQSAIEVSNMFLKGGRIVSTKTRNAREREWKADGDGRYTDFPMAILVNRYSASASEIVAAALQDNGRAKVIGERTWGKGSVQNVIELDGGKSALKLTTAEYHRPNGHNIHRREKAKETDEWGVMPDEGFEVKFTPEEAGQYFSWRRGRDVIRHQRAKSEETKTEPPKSEAAEPFVDRQFQKAIDYLIEQLKESRAVSRK